MIIGATGYGGIELIRLLLQHPQIELAAFVSTTQAGEEIAQMYPHLAHLESYWEALDIEKLAEKGDLFFFATPPGVSGKLAPAFLEYDKLVIDLSGDFRLGSHDYERWYQRPAAPVEWQNQAVYGLSEWEKEKIATAQLIANPGCFATAVLLALLPLLKHRVIDSQRIVVDGKTGVSGAGRNAKKELLYTELNENIRPYRITGHQHIPEMEHYISHFAQLDMKLTFVPHLIPLNRGIIVTIYGSLAHNHKYSKEDLLEVYRHYYSESPFIRLMSQGVPQSKQVQGSNYCDIGWEIDERTGQLIVIATIDNLVKGAAGQAIQNANIRLGLPQESGLLGSPLYP